MTKRQQQQQQEVQIQLPSQQPDVFEFYLPNDVIEEPQQQQQHQHQTIENNMNNLSIYDYFSCSPSSLSSSSFSSNASDGTCTPVSYYGDNTSERSETPSSLNEQTLSASTLTTAQLSPPKNNTNGGAYCGYVESYPYYYKLNRLYNALAIQKLQTDKFKKIMRNKQQYQQPNSISPVSKSPSTPPTTSIQIPQQQNYRNKQQKQNFNRKFQQKTQPVNSTLVVDASSPSAQYLTQPQTQSESSIVEAETTTTTAVNSNDSTIFDTMNWLRGPDLVKSKN